MKKFLSIIIKLLLLVKLSMMKFPAYAHQSKGYVMTLQKFEKLLREGVHDGSVKLTETTIETDNIFEL